jgi:hypothetical protein
MSSLEETKENNNSLDLERQLARQRAKVKALQHLSPADQAKALLAQQAIQAILARERSKPTPPSERQLRYLEETLGAAEVLRLERGSARPRPVDSRKQQERADRKVEARHQAAATTAAPPPSPALAPAADPTLTTKECKKAQRLQAKANKRAAAATSSLEAAGVPYSEMTPKERNVEKRRMQAAHKERAEEKLLAKDQYMRAIPAEQRAQYEKRFQFMYANWVKWREQYTAYKLRANADVEAWKSERRRTGGAAKTPFPVVSSWLDWNEGRRAARLSEVQQMVRYASSKWMEMSYHLWKVGVVSSSTGKEHPPGTPFVLEIKVPGEAEWDHRFEWRPVETTFRTLEDVRRAVELSVAGDRGSDSTRFWKAIEQDLTTCDFEQAFVFSIEMRNDPLHERQDVDEGRRYGQGLCYGHECAVPERIADMGPVKKAHPMCGGPHPCGWYIMSTVQKGCGYCPVTRFCSDACKRAHLRLAHPESPFVLKEKRDKAAFDARVNALVLKGKGPRMLGDLQAPEIRALRRARLKRRAPVEDVEEGLLSEMFADE